MTDSSDFQFALGACRVSDKPTSRISLRKHPKQARSAELVAIILEAAVQVLEAEGVQRFTTARVAERAGVSVGSLYQYFPNKASILFRLQRDEWRQTMALFRSILDDTPTPPLERLRTLVHTFIRSECEEVAMRTALNDAAPFYRDEPEAHATRGERDMIILTFMREALPGVSEEERGLVANLVITTLSSVGKLFSEQPRSEEEIQTYADAMADMFCAYMRHIEPRQNA